MAHTTFQDYNQNTPIVSAWLNDVDSVVYPPTAGLLVAGGGYAKTTTVIEGAAGTVLVSNGPGVPPSFSNLTGSGTVTFVGLSLPNFLSVSGSPVTTTGTLTATLATQTANTVFAGPSSGGDAAPTFRQLTTADITGLSGFAPLNSPAFTGTPTAPTAAAGTNTTQLSTTAFVQNVGLNWSQTAGIGLTTNTTLTVAQMGRWGILQANGVVVTLPLASTVPYGIGFTLARAPFYGSLVTQGGDLLQPEGASVRTLYGNESITVVSNGAGAWFVPIDAASATNPNFAGTQISFISTGGATDQQSISMTRTANYSGGSGVNGTVRIVDTVGASPTSFEWALTSIMNNSATAGENVAVYGQGNRQTTTTGATWAGVMEAREVVAINNPSTALVGLEVDNRSNGTDASGNRIGIDVVAARYNTSGAATTCSYGVRVQNDGDSSVTVNEAFSVVANNCNYGFDTSAGVINIAAMRMAAGQAIAFDVNSTNQLKYDGTGLGYYVSGSEVVRLNSSGSLSLNGAHGLQLQASLSTGGVTPVLTANKPGSSSGIGTWVSLIIDGNQYWIPAWSN